MDRQVQRGTGDQFLIVKITGVRARRTARKTPYEQGRRNPDRSPKRSHLQRDAGAKCRSSCLSINPDQFESSVRKIIRERTAATTESSHAIGMQKFESKNIDFDDIPRLSTF